MKLSEEMAVRLHRMMWSDMQKELGDNLCSGRATYKAEWLDKHFPGEHFMHNCFLCEYVMQQTGIRPLLECAECKICPIKWPGDNCSLREREGGVNYLQSSISDILALPARNPEIDKPVENSYAEFRERLLSAYSGIPASSAIEDHVMAIKKKARNGDKSINDRDLMTLAYCNTKTELAKASGLPEEDATTDHIKAIQEKAVQQSNLSKIYGDTKMELAKASGLPAGETTTNHIKAIREVAVTPDDYGYKEVKKLLSDASGLEDFFTVGSHIKKIQEKAVEEYFAKTPGSKLATMDVDQAFKQYADEQKAPIFKQLSKASGLSENNHAVADHIEWIKNKSKQEGRDETNEHMKYLLAKQSGLDRNRPVDYHIREIVKNSMEAGAAEERDRIHEKIYEVILS